MTPDARQKLRQMLLRDEAFRQFPYTDTTGHLTVGIGRNLCTRGIFLDEALTMLDNDINYFNDKLGHFCTWFAKLNEPRQLALINLCFNVGIHAFIGFTRLNAALEKEDYGQAAQEMKDIHINEERKERIINILLTGEIH